MDVSFWKMHGGVRTQGLCFKHFSNRRCLLPDSGNSENLRQENWRLGIFLMASFPRLPIFATRFGLNSWTFSTLPSPSLCMFFHFPSEHSSQLLVKFCSEVYFFPRPKSHPLLLFKIRILILNSYHLMSTHCVLRHHAECSTYFILLNPYNNSSGSVLADNLTLLKKQHLTRLPVPRSALYVPRSSRDSGLKAAEEPCSLVETHLTLLMA